MTTATRVPIAITAAGVQQTLTIPTDTVLFVPSGKRDFIRIVNSSASVACTMTITHEKDCDMDQGHDFTVVVPVVGSAPLNDVTFVIPYIDHYIAADGTITLAFSAKTDVAVGIFRMPAYQ